MTSARQILFYITLVYNVNLGESVLKTWKYNTSIHNRENLVGGKPTRDCNSFQFAEINFGSIIIDDIETGQLILPNFGDIILKDGGSITFNPLPRECIRLKTIRANNWFSPLSWKFEGNDNVAMPDDQKFPCQFDDIIIPEPTSILYYASRQEVDIKIRSLIYGSKKYDENEIGPLFEHLASERMFRNPYELSYPKINKQKECTDPTGCVCQEKFYLYCFASLKSTCVDPVEAYGFCNKLCGDTFGIDCTNFEHKGCIFDQASRGYITFEYEDGFQLSRIQEMLKKYTDVDTFAGKVRTPYRVFIQVVFAEKEYLGDSADYTQEFFEILKKEQKRLKISNLEVYTSGASIVSVQYTSNVLSIVFGTLAGVIVIFGVIFYLYSDEERIYYLKNGLGWGSRPLAGLKVPFSAKYVKEEESGLIVERHSLTDPTPLLDKSFDNPMFGASTSKVTDVDDKQEDKRIKILTPPPQTIEHENPLYGLGEKLHSENSSDENEE